MTTEKKRLTFLAQRAKQLAGELAAAGKKISSIEERLTRAQADLAMGRTSSAAVTEIAHELAAARDEPAQLEAALEQVRAEARDLTPIVADQTRAVEVKRQEEASAPLREEFRRCAEAIVEAIVKTQTILERMGAIGAEVRRDYPLAPPPGPAAFDSLARSLEYHWPDRRVFDPRSPLVDPGRPHECAAVFLKKVLQGPAPQVPAGEWLERFNIKV